MHAQSSGMYGIIFPRDYDKYHIIKEARALKSFTFIDHDKQTTPLVVVADNSSLEASYMSFSK